MTERDKSNLSRVLMSLVIHDTTNNWLYMEPYTSHVLTCAAKLSMVDETSIICTVFAFFLLQCFHGRGTTFPFNPFHC